MAERFQTLMDYGNGGKLLVGKPGNKRDGYDWKWWPVIKIECTEEWGDNAPKEVGMWHVSLLVVSPAAAGRTQVDQAFGSAGFGDDPALDNPTELMKVEALATYGIFAVAWQKGGNNLRELLKEARKEAGFLRTMFGFYMDRQANLIGATGWDAIKGDLIPKRLLRSA